MDVPDPGGSLAPSGRRPLHPDLFTDIVSDEVEDSFCQMYGMDKESITARRAHDRGDVRSAQR